MIEDKIDYGIQLQALKKYIDELSKAAFQQFTIFKKTPQGDCLKGKLHAYGEILREIERLSDNSI